MKPPLLTTNWISTYYDRTTVYYNTKTNASAYSNLEQQRQELLHQLVDLRELRRGSLTEQFLTVKHADGSKVKRGPYPLFSRKQANKTVSVRLTDPSRGFLRELA